MWFAEDSNAHAIFWCIFAQEVWELMDYPFLKGQKEELSFKNVLFYATECLEKDEPAMMLITTWVLWSERNKFTHKKQWRTPVQIKDWLASYYEEIKKSHESEGRALTGREIPLQHRVDVEMDDLTLFVDAALSALLQRVGLGAVIITTNNKIQASLSKPLEGTLSAIHAEVLAIIAGLRWAQTLGLPLKKILTDSQSLVQALNNTTEYHNELGIFISDIKMLKQNFPGASISHVSQNFNLEAHRLAKHALQLEAEESWLDDFPHTDENF